MSQKVNAGRLLAPATQMGIVLRNLLFTALAVFAPFMKLIERPAATTAIEDCDRLPADPVRGIRPP